jgi:hypothetical protein
VLAIGLLLLLGTGLGLLRFKRSVDRMLTSSRRAVIDQHSVYLKSRIIIPQTRPGFSLFPAMLSAREGVFFQDYLFVTSGQGLVQFDQDGREVRRYSALDGLPSNHLTALGKSVDALWIAVGPQGLLKFTGGQFEYIYAERASDFEVTALLAMPSGELWVGTKQRGLLIFQNDRAVEFAPTIDARFITALQGDHQQAVIGTFNAGAWVYRLGILSHFRKTAGENGSLLDDQVTSVAGNLEAIYVGTPLGVTEIRNGKTSRNFAEGLTIRSLTTASRPLAATDQGLVILNANPPNWGSLSLRCLNNDLSGSLASLPLELTACFLFRMDGWRWLTLAFTRRIPWSGACGASLVRMPTASKLPPQIDLSRSNFPTQTSQRWHSTKTRTFGWAILNADWTSSTREVGV